MITKGAVGGPSSCNLGGRKYAAFGGGLKQNWDFSQLLKAFFCYCFGKIN